MKKLRGVIGVICIIGSLFGLTTMDVWAAENEDQYIWFEGKNCVGPVTFDVPENWNMTEILEHEISFHRQPTRNEEGRTSDFSLETFSFYEEYKNFNIYDMESIRTFDKKMSLIQDNEEPRYEYITICGQPALYCEYSINMIVITMVYYNIYLPLDNGLFVIRGEASPGIDYKELILTTQSIRIENIEGITDTDAIMASGSENIQYVRIDDLGIGLAADCEIQTIEETGGLLCLTNNLVVTMNYYPLQVNLDDFCDFVISHDNIEETIERREKVLIAGEEAIILVMQQIEVFDSEKATPYQIILPNEDDGFMVLSIIDLDDGTENVKEFLKTIRRFNTANTETDLSTVFDN